MGELIALPSPRDNLSAQKPQFCYAWRHDLESVEFQRLRPNARCVYLALLLCADNDTQVATAGLSRLGRLAGLERHNVPRAVRELEAAGLVRTAREVSSSGAHKRNRYTLLCAPSALLELPTGQLALPYRRLSFRDARALRARRR